MDVTPRETAASIGEGGDTLDLTPRTGGAAPTRGRRKWLGPVLVAAVVLVGAGVVYALLNSATTYYCNADEIGTKAGCEAGKRFRLLGNVDDGSIVVGTPFRFTVSHNGRTVPVTYEGEPAGKFQACVPVLVEGAYDGTAFEGDRIIVRHDENYAERNPGRVEGYDERGACDVAAKAATQP